MNRNCIEFIYDKTTRTPRRVENNVLYYIHNRELIYDLERLTNQNEKQIETAEQPCWSLYSLTIVNK